MHAIKGGEAPHVIVYSGLHAVCACGSACHEFNLFGHRSTTEIEHSQDRNLLYIALTRATHTLTFLVHRRTQHVQSPFLPIEMVHYARELWTNDSD